MSHHEHHGSEGHAQAKLKLLASPLITKQEVSPSASAEYFNHHENTAYAPYDAEPGRPHQINDDAMHETPQFQRHEEATTIELFYDLFFVANLTTFTSIHEINENRALASYAGFFCILWFTWCQVSLFDVRYVTDSILERITKACQFGVMVGFAVVGPNFDPSSQKQNTFRALSLILAISRFILALQYTTVMWHVKNYKKTKLPLLLIVISNVIAAFIYLGVTFAFKSKKDGHSHVYLIWYVVAVLETAFNIAVSSRWKVMSFKGTHLVQRMSLLTLIILGEGIIVVCKSISKIVKNEFAWSSSTIGTIIAAVTIIYILYMLYFDWLTHQHFGSIRQQIWAFLHFPFHLSLVLFMEGTAQFIIWRKLTEIMGFVKDAFLSALNVVNSDPSASWDDLVQTMNDTTAAVFESYPPIYAKTYNEVDEALHILANATADDDSAVMTGIETLIGSIQNSLFETYGIVAPKEKNYDYNTSTTDSVMNELYKKAYVIGLVFVYLFVTAGLTLLLMNILYYLTISHKSSGKLSKGNIFRLAFNTLVGVLLCVIAAMVNTTAGANYAQSSWILPTVAITLFVVLIMAHVKKGAGKIGREGH